MPKPATYPRLFNSSQSISITEFVKWGRLEPDYSCQGTIRFSCHGQETGSIGYFIYTRTEDYFIELSYTFKGEPVKYRIPIVSTPSNLGKGQILYFLCPVTGKRARKLYGAGKYFLHRTAFKNCLYEKQTYSHRYRTMNKIMERACIGDDIFGKIYSKHFKKTYNGIGTKRYVRLMKKVIEADKIDTSTLLMSLGLR